MPVIVTGSTPYYVLVQIVAAPSGSYVGDFFADISALELLELRPLINKPLLIKANFSQPGDSFGSKWTMDRMDASRGLRMRFPISNCRGDEAVHRGKRPSGACVQ